MNCKVSAVYFSGPDDFHIALNQLVIARVATAALHSKVEMRTEVFTWHDEDAYLVHIDTTEDAGRTLCRILTALLEYHIGNENYTVCPAMEEEIRKIAKWKEDGCA